MSRSIILLKDFADCERFLGRKESRKLSSVRSTTVIRLSNQRIAIKYHGTLVVIHAADGRTELNSGGYKTVTTKRRMNEHTNSFVFQKSFTWYVQTNGIVREFHDHMMIGEVKAQDYQTQLRIFS